ncbi:MAG: aminomethyl-transferring glycine dehydrogenase [Pseudomonadales bacterium]
MVHRAFRLADLDTQSEFIARHIGPGEQDQQTMLQQLGLPSLQALIAKVVPAAILANDGLNLDVSCSEQQALSELRGIAEKNQIYKSFIGQGYYNCHTPSVIQRNILENPAWYTAYTPYQPEISQGRLEALLNYQTLIVDLTGMDLANASLLDEATAAAEAMALCRNASKAKSNVFFVVQDCLPQTIDVLRTRAEPMGIELVIGDALVDLPVTDCFGVLLQYPGVDGVIHDYSRTIDDVHQRGGLVIMAADLLSLMILQSPGELDADVAVGSSQRFGVPLGFGGPHAAYMGIKDKFKRLLPGRLVGLSQDINGKPAYRLALQTREQHIRREKATSNICTAQVLLAIMASMYAVYHGPAGLRAIAERVHRSTVLLAAGLRRLGYSVGEAAFFDTLLIDSGEQTSAIHQAAQNVGVNLRQVDPAHVGVSLDETTQAVDIELLWQVFALGQIIDFSVAELDSSEAPVIPENMMRSGEVLSHPVFNRYHSETDMLRYLRCLADKDIALDRAMIPLGSCTMKLNASSEMLPISWPQFSAIHPFAPTEQTRGYHELTDSLQTMLCEITGYDEVSLQPNAGSQGEYAGLLAIRHYHQSRGEEHRNVCLIPSSAHGTNPASAQMCGLQVVVVSCDEQGNVDLDDLSLKCDQHGHQLAAMMITYPSTHGVFEEKIVEACELIHQHGGQVYMDGANLNAMVGLCYPGKFGGDVSHLNLHKTFCIPHGGGGPGVGPIGVKKHLAPFLPGHQTFAADGRATGAVAAAPWGSAGILPISWMYIRMMGRAGLTQATKVAILNANYIAERLKQHYPILYSGAQGMVAHECILDLTQIKESTGISVDDVAKRLIDFGFHAPTMSFPVAGTLMIEPTESESLQELERFCDAMICIRQEITALQAGEMDEYDNPLKNAPHTAAMVTDDEWLHSYSRKSAAYPQSELGIAKYWPPVGRVDNVYGDRHLFCTCAPMADYDQV